MNNTSLVPVKLLKNVSNKREILRFMKDKPILDYEDRMTPASFLAIDNASEIARIIFQKPGVFETISSAISQECNCRAPAIGFQCTLTNVLKNNPSRTRNEFIHLGTTLEGGAGHYAGVIVNHNTKKINISDSIGKSSGEINKFINALRREYPGYEIINNSNVKGTQPTGGFFAKNVSKFKRQLLDAGINVSTLHDKIVNQLYKITQFDELSQHHFCYIESFLYICHKILKTPMGESDPRRRIIFIKKVIWGLVHKFRLLETVPIPVKNYFLKNFKYYVQTTTMNNRPIPLKGGRFQIPNNIPPTTRTQVPIIYKTRIVRIDMPDVTPNTSIKRIIELATI